MSLGVCLSATSLYFAFKPSTNVAEARKGLLYAAMIGSYYCFAGMTAILYPGADWYDPPQTPASPQKWMFPTQIVVLWIGCWLEVRRLGKTKAA